MKKVLLMAVSVALASGCATQGGMDNKQSQAAAGAGIGCVAGALLAKAIGGNASAGCMAGGLAGALIGYEQARKQELAAAQSFQNDVVSTIPGSTASQVKTETVIAKEKDTGQEKKVSAYKSASVEIPLSMRGTPEFNDVMKKVKNRAETLANDRGEARVIVAMSPSDMRAQRVSASNEVLANSSGTGTVHFERIADSSIKKGVERITIETVNKPHVTV